MDVPIARSRGEGLEFLGQDGKKNPMTTMPMMKVRPTRIPKLWLIESIPGMSATASRPRVGRDARDLDSTAVCHRGHVLAGLDVEATAFRVRTAGLGWRHGPPRRQASEVDVQRREGVELRTRCRPHDREFRPPGPAQPIADRQPTSVHCRLLRRLRQASRGNGVGVPGPCRIEADDLDVGVDAGRAVRVVKVPIPATDADPGTSATLSTDSGRGG